MKRSFSVTLKKTGHAISISGVTTYQVIATNAKSAIDKATRQLRKDEVWQGGVVVESLTHRGSVI